MLHTETIMFLFLVLAVASNLQLSTNLPQLQQHQLQKFQRVEMSEDNKLIGINLPEVKFQISSRVGLKIGDVEDQDLFKFDQYSEQLADQACDLYPTSLDFIARASFTLTGSIYRYLVSEQLNKYLIYVIDTKYLLSIYTFDKINIKLLQQHPINSSIPQISENSSNIEILENSGNLYLFSTSGMFVFQNWDTAEHRFIKVEGYLPTTRVVAVGSMQSSNNNVWVADQENIYIYEISATDHKKVTKTHQLNKVTQSPILSARYQNSTFFLLSQLTLTLHRWTPSQSPPPPISYSLPSSCSSVWVHPKTLYLTCRYEHQTYIAQLLLHPTNATVDVLFNQYYTDAFVQGVNKVRKIGNQIIAVLGDQEIVIVNQAVHRHVLIDLGNRYIRQYQQRFSAFGLVDIHYISKYSTFEQSNILLLSQSEMTLLTVIYQPPQLQCQFSREQHSTSVSILLQFNTTVCPVQKQNPNLQPEYREEQSGSICTLSFPYTVYISEKDQYEYKQANFILFLALTLLIALIILGLAHSVKIKKKAESIERHLRNKIQKFKKMKELKEMKEVNAI